MHLPDPLDLQQGTSIHSWFMIAQEQVFPHQKMPSSFSPDSTNMFQMFDNAKRALQCKLVCSKMQLLAHRNRSTRLCKKNTEQNDLWEPVY